MAMLPVCWKHRVVFRIQSCIYILQTPLYTAMSIPSPLVHDCERLRVPLVSFGGCAVAVLSLVYPLGYPLSYISRDLFYLV